MGAGLLKILLLSVQSGGNLEDLIFGSGPGDLLLCHRGVLCQRSPTRTQHQSPGPSVQEVGTSQVGKRREFDLGDGSLPHQEPTPSF